MDKGRAELDGGFGRTPPLPPFHVERKSVGSRPPKGRSLASKRSFAALDLNDALAPPAAVPIVGIGCLKSQTGRSKRGTPTAARSRRLSLIRKELRGEWVKSGRFKASLTAAR